MEEQSNEKKRFPVLPATLCGLLLLGCAAYGGGVYYYHDRFLKGTVVDKIDVSGMTIEDLKARMEDYRLNVVERKQDGTTLEEEIPGSAISLTYSSTEPLKEYLKSQNAALWFLPQSAEHRTEGLTEYDDEALQAVVDGLYGFQSDFYAPPEDAYISDYSPEEGFAVIAEVPGNELDRSRTMEAVRQAVEGLEGQVNLDEAGCYKEPTVTSKDEQLLGLMERLQKYEATTITYTFGNEKEVLDGKTICSWLSVEPSGVTLDQAKVEEYVASLRKKYDTIFRPRKFKTSYGKEVTINNGDYGWWMDYEQEAVELAKIIEAGESAERTPLYHQTAAAYGEQDYGATYVEINLSAQHLFFYKDGSLALESDFVSGNPSRGNGTPDGIYGVTYKQRNATLTGENYRTPVSYWMPFNLNIGMHDANWRSSFGGNIYKTNGSHGCINLPPSIAKQIYESIEKGTPVICYFLPGTEPPERLAPAGAQPATSAAGEAEAVVPQPVVPEVEIVTGM